MKIKCIVSLAGLAIIWSLCAQPSTPPTSVAGANAPKTPCDAATWRNESHTFPTGQIAIPQDILTNVNLPPATVQFDATLRWQQKDYVKPDGTKFICSLKDPSINIYGIHIIPVFVFSDPNSPYAILVHPENYDIRDKLLIDSSVVTPNDYTSAINLAMNGNPTSVPPIPVTWTLGRGGTTVTNSGGRDVTWNWLQRLPQPQIVSIAGNEGRKIEIDHNSPDVVILGIFDRNNNRVQISGRTSFQHLWQMKHIIQAN